MPDTESEDCEEVDPLDEDALKAAEKRLSARFDKTKVYDIVDLEAQMSLSQAFYIVAFGVFGERVPTSEAVLEVGPDKQPMNGFQARVEILRAAAGIVFPPKLLSKFEQRVLSQDQSNPVVKRYVNGFGAQLNTRLGLCSTACNSWLGRNLFSALGPEYPWGGES